MSTEQDKKNDGEAYKDETPASRVEVGPTQATADGPTEADEADEDAENDIAENEDEVVGPYVTAEPAGAGASFGGAPTPTTFEQLEIDPNDKSKGR